MNPLFIGVVLTSTPLLIFLTFKVLALFLAAINTLKYNFHKFLRLPFRKKSFLYSSIVFIRLLVFGDFGFESGTVYMLFVSLLGISSICFNFFCIFKFLF